MKLSTLDSIELGHLVLIREQLLKAQAEGKKVYRFESGDPGFSLSPQVLKALQDAAANGKTHYVETAGIPELRAAFAKKAKEKNNIPAEGPGSVFVTNGSMHGLFVTFSCLLEDGDEVIVPDPLWAEITKSMQLAGGVPVEIPLSSKTNFEYDAATVEAKITPKTRAIFMNSPQNPTGALLSPETIQKIVDLAIKRNLWIISDEAYEDIVFENYKHVSPASLVPKNYDKCVTLFSFSKSYAMSGLRIGCVITNNKLLKERIPKMIRCSINGVNSVAQWAATAAVTGGADHLHFMFEEYVKRRTIMLKALEGIPFVKPFVPRGGFFCWVELEAGLYQKLGVKDAVELSAQLAARGIGSAPGVSFGNSCKDAVRFSFSCDTKMVEEGSVLLRKVLLEGF